jgi:glycosyltransferase involved in cell wall biosynthesis
MSVSLSIVVPVHDEAAHLPATVDALAVALDGAGFEAELVLVDDGSTDGSAEVARAAADGRMRFRAIVQEQSGRFRARRAGIEAAEGECVLLLDGRVRLEPGALAAVRPRVEAGERVWNGHVHVETRGNPYGAFGEVLVALAWRDYFSRPRETSYDASDFDRYPKGTTCFLAPRELLRAAFDAFRSGYEDLRHANDDTPIVRWIAERERVHLSPAFACAYTPRRSLGAFLRHSFHRGIVFLDGHGRRESRFFPAVVAFYPASAAFALGTARRPGLAAAATAVGMAVAGALAAAARRSPSETAAFAGLAPVYALAHGAGMWRGLWLLLRRRLAAAHA